MQERLDLVGDQRQRSARAVAAGAVRSGAPASASPWGLVPVPGAQCRRCAAATGAEKLGAQAINSDRMARTWRCGWCADCSQKCRSVLFWSLLASVEDMHGGFSMESIKNPAEKAGHVNGLDRKSSIEALGARDLFQVRPLGDF